MQTLRVKTVITRLTAIGAAALLAFAAPSPAQTPAGGNGRALDANQQIGSGGVNALEGQVDYRRRNDMVTGNVGGGRAFRDDVGYGAVGEFQDNLGSDSLFNFRAQSLSSSPSYFNAANVGGATSQGYLSVYRSFSNRVAQPMLSPGLIAPDGGGYQLSPYSAFSSIYATPLDTRLAGRALRTREPGLALRAFTDSPTLESENQQAVTSEALSSRLEKTAQQAGQYVEPDSLGDTLRYDTNVYDPFSKTAIEESRKQQTLEAGQLPPTMLIGQQLQTQLDPNPDPALAQDPTRSRQVLDSVFKRLDSEDAQADDADAYTKLLRSIRDRDKAATQPDEWTDALESPTDQQLTEAERAYDAVMKDIYGEDYKSRKRSTTTPTTTPDDTTDESGEHVGDVVDQLNYDLPRLETLASNKKTRVANLTREAEAALAEGKYLTAESRYRQLLLDIKDDPMPRVGLIHAQLGAGMFRSAGMNLRALFVQHPELIAARYDAKLLPPQDRLHWIQSELQTVISQGEGGKDAPLLMAYLGYQAGSQQVVRYGMAMAQAESPRDPLLAVIREIWLDEADSSSDGK